ncbi:hypothetical protein [Aeromonas rivipollensis]|uniref:hypothetical protein n=1 Tax=Aeromonas rivipollensis TaxID=948519 RepID=UPI0013D682AB|nr:hypothetical protein [Aeromonas rivipollensis]NEX82897.1 hypothetical protein [Aeromonas rivipollensis]
MSNWFENNPTKSVLLHTIVVATATWAAFTFIFDENRVKFHEAKVTKAEAETKEIGARNTVLVTRIDYLTKENDRLQRWLESEPKTIPYYEKHVAELSKKIESLEGSLNEIRSSASEKQSEGLWKEVMKKYDFIQMKPVQTSIRDPHTNLVIGAERISSSGSTKIRITFPDGERIEKDDVYPGDTWDYTYKGSKFRLILDSADWASQQYSTRIIELGQSGAQ